MRYIDFIFCIWTTISVFSYTDMQLPLGFTSEISQYFENLRGKDIYSDPLVLKLSATNMEKGALPQLKGLLLR